MLTSPRFACPPSLLTPLLSPFLYVIPHPVGPNVSLFQARHLEKTALLPSRSILKGLWISDMSIWRRGANWFCLPHSNAWLYQRADTIQKLLTSGHAHQSHLQCMDPFHHKSCCVPSLSAWMEGLVISPCAPFGACVLLASACLFTGRSTTRNWYLSDAIIS